MSGAISSGIGSGIDVAGGGAVEQFLGSGLSGGIGSAISGGSFWQGLGIGLAVGGLNHAVHSLMASGPPWEYNGHKYYSKTNLYLAILVDQAATQFGIKDVAALAAVITGAPLLSTRKKFKGATPRTSIASKYLSKIPGKSPIRLPSVTGYPKIIGGSGLKVAFTKVIGRFVGRAVPIVGWGVLTYDVGMTLYNTQVTYNQIVND